MGKFQFVFNVKLRTFKIPEFIKAILNFSKFVLITEPNIQIRFYIFKSINLIIIPHRLLLYLKQISMEKHANSISDTSKPFKLFILQNQIIIAHRQSSQSLSSPCLSISRTSNHMAQKILLVRELHQMQGILAIRQAYLFVGILNVQGEEFVILASEAKIVGIIQGHMIYEITKIEWLPRSRKQKKTQLIQQTQQAISDLIENGGYYFSYKYNLSRSKQSSPTEDEYVWNEHLLWQCRRFNISPQFQIPIIQGFVGVLMFQFIHKPKVVYALISRKSNKRAGTRFFTRGIDDQSNVANYVETEQLIFIGRDVISHIGIRGSVPLFWEQKGIDGIQSKLTMSRSLEMSQKAFIGHLHHIKQLHKRCFVINLLNKNKESEAHLTQQFQKIINSNHNIIQDFVRYEYFNFHQVCGSNHFERCNPLIQKIKSIIESFSYYHTRDGKVLSTQQGIVRTNCLDCLDRTNFIQAKIAITIFEIILRNLDFQFSVNMTENMDSVDCLKMVKDFKTLWADNGDMISMHYTGMPSTHTDVTREGKRTFFGMINHKLKSLGRFYKQFTDVKKQQIINLLHGYTLIEGSINHRFQKQLKQLKSEYSAHTPITVMVITWNVQFTNCPRRFFSKIGNIKDLPNIVVVGLQNVYQSNKLIQNKDEVVEYTKNSWKKLLEVQLAKQCGYTILSQKYAEGSGLFIYFKSSGFNKQKQIHLWDIGGFSTTCINFSRVLDKSSQAILMTKVKIQDSSFLFANFNFDKAVDLLEHGGNIHQDAFQHTELGRQRQERIEGMDYRFLFGNMGETLLQTKQSVFNVIKKHKQLSSQNKHSEAAKIVNQLGAYDVIHRSKDTHPYLYHYNEGPLHFLPTSTFITPDVYDSEQTPSYSSRILMYNVGSSIAKQHMYEPLYQQMSHHLPVIALYSMDVLREDKHKKKQIAMRIVHK